MTAPIAPSFCSRCGSQVNAGAHFCTVCGNDVSGQQESLATQLLKAEASRPAVDVWGEQLQLLRDATIGEYEILGELGRGGMAAVYLAHEFALERKVAIKVMSPALVSGEGMIERFKREARTAASLSHPHIIPVYAVRESERLLYFVMKFIAGRPLDGVLKELGPLPIPMIQMVLQQVGGAFGYAHRRGIIHRDIKPANIMIDEEGWAVVTDFGIAKVSQAEGLTMTGMTVGTPTYMSPEQCMAQDVTGASDQYSLGVVAYEMITGRPPFSGGSMMAIMYGHFNDPPPPIDQARPDCPPELKAAVMRMLEKDPANRWPSLEDAVEALGEPPPKSDDAMRTQLVEIAKKSENTKLLKRLSTPISPTPLTKRTRQGAAAPTVPARSATATPRSVPTRAPVVASPAPAPKKTGLLIGAVAAVAVAGGALALWRPWATGDTAAPAPPAAVAADTTPAAPPPAPVTNVVTNPAPAPADSARAVAPADTAPAPAPGPSPADLAAERRNKAEFQRRLDDFRQARQRAVNAGASDLQLGPGDDFRKLADRQSSAGDWKSALVALTDGVESFKTAETAARDRAQLAAAQARAQQQRPPATQAESTAPQRPAQTQQPATQPAADPPPAPVVVDERPSVELVIREYARALSASDLPAMLAVFPTMPAQIKSGYQEMFKQKFSLDTSRWKYLEINLNGRSATARLGGVSIVRDNRGKPKSEEEFPRQASLEKGPNGWRLTSIQ